MSRRGGQHPVVLLITATVLYGCSAGGSGGTGDAPQGSGDVAAGRDLYARNCAACHGPQAEGTAQGPTFLDPVYVPSHHADEAFQAAVARGVQPHHWDFGPMPPIPSLSRDEVTDITAYVRSLQAEAGMTD